jgi:predicted ABC-type transport system involved in lysophospholipase L1 biosynthesis ATPase subunit
LLIEAHEIHKTYSLPAKSLHVLRGASIKVAAAETVSVVGPSGAGKSTLLHVLGGLDRPDRGKVMIEGVDLYGVSGARRSRIRATRIGFVFQSYHLLPEMDVLENVMLAAMAAGRAGVSRGAMRERGRELLASVGLAERCSHTPLELSGGEQQRVALARALMNDPQLVFADEPTGNLDDETGAHVLDCLFRLTKERGHSLVVVTHNTRIAGSCDRVLHLRDGRLG